MKLYLSGYEAHLIKKALASIVAQGGTDGDNAREIIDRIEKCLELQKPHKPTR